ncbi:hypothetical protein PSQ19_15370 [Devosia algicola]|uniref:Uncharacterized protein n=1 Tax=Devosia algicola TaxID=3026418 RepID=A0ABY7YLB3_9HYPH|nr:hypothetical protein [Devosia algicola]WDR02041.1 hypothetical protein PSQ19_15370 [Devosia algicola]
MRIFAFAGSLTRQLPQYGAANGEGITQFELDPTSGKLTVKSVEGAIEDRLLAGGQWGRGPALCDLRSHRF